MAAVVQMLGPSPVLSIQLGSTMPTAKDAFQEEQILGHRTTSTPVGIQLLLHPVPCFAGDDRWNADFDPFTFRLDSNPLGSARDRVILVLIFVAV